MKKLFIFATFLFIAINSFSQDKTFDENITQLMYAKNGMGGVEKITDQLANSLSDDKKSTFTTALNNVKAKFIIDAKAKFKQDYTNEQIVAIYDEYHSTKINYTDETNRFFSKFRALKGHFFKKAKELYFEYKN